MNTILLAALIAAQAFDVTSTAIKLRQGCREALFPTQSPAVIGALKSGATAYLVWQLPKMKPKISIPIAGIGITSGVIGGIHNMRQDCK